MSINWLLLLLMVGYAFFNGFGSYFYKKGLNKIDDPQISFTKFRKKNIYSLFSLFTNPTWLLGLLALGIDFILYQIALQRFEISSVKPLVNLNLIFVLFFGVIILKEKIHKIEWFALILIIIGALLVSLNAKEQVNSVDILHFWIFSGIFFLLTAFLIGILNYRSKSSYEFFGSLLSGIFFGIGSLFNKVFLTPGISSIFFSLNVVFFLLSYLLAFLFGQTSYLKGRMSIVSVLVNIMSILIPFIGGVFVFNEEIFLTEQQGVWRYTKIIGILLILAGIYVKMIIPNETEEKKNNA